MEFLADQENNFQNNFQNNFPELARAKMSSIRSYATRLDKGSSVQFCNVCLKQIRKVLQDFINPIFLWPIYISPLLKYSLKQLVSR